MKTWVWVLLVVAAVALFMWSARHEGFQSTPTLHGPPYGENDYSQIVGMMPPALVTALRTKNSAGPAPTEPDAESTPADRASYEADLSAYHKKLVDGIISSTMGEFYRKYYQPATVSVTNAKVDTFMTEYLAQIQTTSPSVHTFLLNNKAGVSALLVAYFVAQPAGAANGPLLGPNATPAQQAAALAAAQQSANASTASGYDALLAAMGQGPVGATGGTGGTGATGATGAATGTGGTGAAGGTTPSPSSVSNRGNIWGPAFTGLGNNAGSGAAGARDYPTLIGPGPTESTMVEGGGIMNLSQNKTLPKSGALPSGAGTGSDPNSRFFGSSRTPGDRDLIPDPNQEFTPSIGSSKTEPVPYLADFSAFAT
jgi:hypothetical protein